MRKIYLLILTLFSVSLSVSAQNSAAWLRQGELLRNPLVKAKLNSASLSEKVALGADGSVYRAGEFIKSFSFNGATVAGFEGGSTYVLKYGVDGAPIWGTSILGEATPTAMISDGEGGVIVVGSYSGIYIHCKGVDGTKVVVDGVEGSSGKIYTFVVRYNAQGNVVFAKGFMSKPTSVDNDYEPHISLNNLAVSMGKVYCTGTFLGTATIGGVEYKSGVYDFFGSPASNPDGLVLALDMASGDVAKVIPFKTYGDLFSWSSYNSIAFDAIGNFYLAGYVRGKAKVEGATNGYELPSNDYMGVAKGLVVASYTASCDYRWSKCFPMQLTAVYEQPLIDPDGIAIKDNEVVVLGRVASNLDLSGTIKVTASDAVKSDYFLAGFSTTDGTPAWASAFGTANDEVKAKMFSQGNAVSIAGSYAGAFNYNGNTLANSVSDSLDCFVASVEGNGVLSKVVSTGGNDHDLISDAAMDASGACYLTGIFRGDANFFGAAPTSSIISDKPAFDWYLMKIVKSVNSIAPAAAQAIKETESGSSLTVTEPTPATSRRWMYSTTSGSGYQAFAIAETGTTYTPKFSTAGVYYVVCESVVDGFTGHSNEVKVTVSKINSIAPAAAQSIKENENGAMLTVTEVGSSTSRQWLFSTTSGSGYLSFATAETGTTYTPKFATAGVYYVVCESVVDGITGRSNEVAITVSKATGIDDVSEGKFKAFPNPSNGEITFSFPEAGGKLEIVDINGRVVYTAIVDALTTTVNISVASGMYMALLNSNGSVSKLKLVIR